MSNVDFSSWPREQEQSFVVYEQRAAESQKKALMISAIASIGLLILALGIYAGVEPEHKDMTKGMNMSNLTKKSKKVTAEPPAPAPAPAAAPTPASDDKPADPASDDK